MDNSPIGIYVHIPFCAVKCPYCDFYSVSYNKDLAFNYISSVITEMTSYKNDNLTIDSIYFGGGTPALIPTEYIKLVIDSIYKYFNVANDCEISLEANPNLLSEKKLSELFSIGINRLSIGLQSANEKELSALGRKHTVKQAYDAVFTAQRIGFNNISLDIMLGTPYQTIDTIDDTLEFIKALPVQHISAYMLKIEEATPFFSSDIVKYCPSEEDVTIIYKKVIRYFNSLQLKQYEISNFSKDGFESRHNLKYWKCLEYIGLGASAHSYYKDLRFCNPPDINMYISNCNGHIITDDNINHAEEHIMLALRLTEGISIDGLCNIASISKDSLIKILDNYISHGLAKIENNRFFLTSDGFLISNAIITDILNICNIF